MTEAPKPPWEIAMDHGIETGRYMLTGERGNDPRDAEISIGPNFQTAPLHDDPLIAAEQRVLDIALSRQQQRAEMPDDPDDDTPEARTTDSPDEPPADPSVEYHVRAMAYRLLVASTGRSALYRETLDKAIEDPHLRDVLKKLVEIAMHGQVAIFRDPYDAIQACIGEMHFAEDLDELKDPGDMKDGEGDK